MKRCANCIGPFGLTRRRHRGHQFCCLQCEAEYDHLLWEQLRHIRVRLFSQGDVRSTSA